MCLCCSPLLFGLEIKEDFEVLNTYKFQSKDYQITPKSTWNYALRLQDDLQPQQDLRVVYSGLEIGVPPFSLKGAPIMIIAEVCPAVTSIRKQAIIIYQLQGRQLESWQVAHMAAGPPPLSPVSSTAPLQTLTLLPFGATELRIAEIPTTLD